MSALAKVFVVVNFVMAVFFFGASATLFLTKVDWKAAYDTYKKSSDVEVNRLRDHQGELSATNDRLTSDLASRTADLDATSADNKKLTERLASSDNEIKIARDQVNQVNVVQAEQSKQMTAQVERNTALEEQLSQATASREAALGDMAQANEERNSIKLDLDKAQGELHAMRVSMDELNSSHEELQLRYNYLAARCPGGKITELPPPIDAKIVAVDAKAKLVVLSVGRNQKVAKGYNFTVYRGNSFVGKVLVFEVYPDLSGARILFTKEGASVEQGDSASTSLN